MKNIALVLCAFCVVVGASGIYGVLDGPYIGIEYRSSGGAWVAASVAPGSPAEAAGLTAGARVLALAGRELGAWDLIDDIDTIPDRASVLSNLATQALLCEAVRPGKPLSVAYLDRSGSRVQATLVPARMPLGFALPRLAKLGLPAVFCLGIGLAVILKRPDDRRARFFFMMLFAVSLIFLTFGPWSSRDTAMSAVVFFPLVAINDLFAFLYFPVFFLRFCLSFPRDLAPARSRAFLAGLYASPFVVLALFIPRLVFEIHPIFWGGCLLGGAVVMARQYFTLRSPVLRAQAKWILWGSMVFGIVMVVTYTLPILFQAFEYYSWLVPSVVFLVVPLTFAFGVLRYRLMDIDALFDATFTYTITIGVLFGLDAFVALGIGVLRGGPWRGPDLLISFATVQVVILLYLPVRRRVERFVKRAFRRELYEAGAVAASVADRLLSARDEADALESFRAAIDETLHPVSVSAHLAIPGASLPASFSPEGEATAKASFERAGEGTMPIDPLVERGEAPEALSGGVVVPLATRGRKIGVLVFGPKRSGNLYSASDLRLLGMVARQTALAVEGAMGRKEAARADAELRGERERVAREIHDGVGGTLSNAIMLCGIARADPEPESARRRVDTLRDLLVDALAELRNLIWAIHDEGGSASELAVFVRERLEKALSERDVRFDFRASVGDGGVVLSARERLNLVRACQELAANSLKHSGSGSIALAIEEGAGELVVDYSDEGRGFDPESARRGFGLANLSKRCAEIGASLEIATAPDRGFRATIRLPLAGRAA